MTVYCVFMEGNTSNSAIELFTTEEEALNFIAKDVAAVIDLLKEDGCNVETAENDAICHAFVSTDCGIWYQWDMYISELRN